MVETKRMREASQLLMKKADRLKSEADYWYDMTQTCPRDKKAHEKFQKAKWEWNEMHKRAREEWDKAEAKSDEFGKPYHDRYGKQKIPTGVEQLGIMDRVMLLMQSRIDKGQMQWPEPASATPAML